MKKIVLIASMLLSVSLFGEGFRNVKWGANLAEIKKSEVSKKFIKSSEEQTQGKYYWNLDLYAFEDSLKSAGKFDVKYVLLENKLIQGSYSQKIKKGNLENYNNMKKNLEDKYGYPQGVYKSSSFLFENGEKNSSAEEILTWYIKDTKIDFILVKDKEFKIVYYTRDKDLVDFIWDKGLEKEREKEKKLMKDSEFIKSKI
ncbi:hypothetical protein [uncultured Ilyobacter sp.]|uniref:hypothetical protein n=1 Tax=uncultured Ilyobacter sp. TaxID=544433 RepID=UPI0029BFDD76|nr:hypothetical protein [uncultured Ilyobacter sp.]